MVSTYVTRADRPLAILLSIAEDERLNHEEPSGEEVASGIPEYLELSRPSRWVKDPVEGENDYGCSFADEDDRKSPILTGIDAPSGLRRS